MKSLINAKYKPTVAGLITEFFGESQFWRKKAFHNISKYGISLRVTRTSISLIGIRLIDYANDCNIVAIKWKTFLTDISPAHSLAIFNAAIAGVVLLSGIISGNIFNRDKNSQVYSRIVEHPLLNKSYGKVRTIKLSELYEKRWAGIISNFWFSVFMRV